MPLTLDDYNCSITHCMHLFSFYEHVMNTNYVYIQNWFQFRSFWEFTLLATLRIQANKSTLWKQALFKTFNSHPWFSHLQQLCFSLSSSAIKHLAILLTSLLFVFSPHSSWSGSQLWNVIAIWPACTLIYLWGKQDHG